MNYNKLQPSKLNAPSEPPLSTHSQSAATTLVPNPRRRRLILISLLSLALILASAISAALLVYLRTRPSSSSLKPTQAISHACSLTLYPNLCITSLTQFPGALTASEHDLIHVSFNMTFQRFSKALYFSSSISYLAMEPIVRSAFDDCMELLDDAVDALSRSLLTVSGGEGSKADVMTWLSGAMTMHDTCREGFEGVSGPVKDQVEERVKELGELVSICLAMYAMSDTGEDGDFSGVPIGNRRLMNGGEDAAVPEWMGKEERELLEIPVTAMQVDMVVSKDGGNGTYKSIGEAIKKAPEHSSRRIIIYVKAGR